MIRRRAAVTGSLAALFAPAIIRTPGLLMPVKAFQFDGPVTATEILQRQETAYSGYGRLVDNDLLEAMKELNELTRKMLAPPARPWLTLSV